MSFQCIVRVHGIFAGIVKSADTEFFNCGDILLCPQLDSSFISFVKKAKAILVQTRPILPHMGVICRMYGVAVIWSPEAEKLRNRYISFNGLTGNEPNDAIQIAPIWHDNYLERNWQVSVYDSHQISQLSKTKFKITFFIRHEFLWIENAFNPFECLEKDGEEALELALYYRLLPFAKAIGKNQRLHFRSIDARSDEFKNLLPPLVKDASEHGLSRGLAYPGILNAEARVCQRIQNEFDLSVIYSFPYVTTISDLKQGISVAKNLAPDVAVGVFIETPEFAHAIINKNLGDLEVFIGTKDLAALHCGFTRGEGEAEHVNPLNYTYFNLLVKRIAFTAAQRGQTCFYFCFLEHFNATYQQFARVIGFSLCAHEFSIIARVKLDRT